MKLTYMSARTVSRVFVALAATAAVLAWVHATPGGTPEDPIEVPGNNDQPTTIDTNSDTDWDYVYIHNNTGRDGNPGKSASKVQVEAKQPVYNKDNQVSSENKRRPRVVVDSVQRKNPETGNWESITDSKDPTDGKGQKVTIGLTQSVPHCETLRVKVRTEVQKQKLVAGGSPAATWKWDDPWLTDNTKVEVNFRLLTGLGDQLAHAGAGEDPFGPGSLALMADVFSGLDPVANFSAAVVAEGAIGQVAAPDLVFSEFGGWQMPVGTLQFVATGGLSFSSSSELAVLARDENGDDAVASEDIAFGAPSVVNGVVQVSVTARNPESAWKVAVMVRGAQVSVPVLAGGTMVGYTAGGSSSGSSPVRIAPLLRVGAEPTGAVTASSATIEFMVGVGDDAAPMSDSVGGGIAVVRPYEGTCAGYLDAIVLGESTSSVMRQGSFEIRPVDGFTFVASADTALYAVNADDNHCVPDAFGDCSIEVTPAGAIRVTLGARQVYDTVLKLVILNPKLNLGSAPFVAGRNARVAIGGDALRRPLDRTVVLVEGAPGTQSYNLNLASAPIAPTVLLPLAEMEQ